MAVESLISAAQSKCPKYDCGEVPEPHFEDEKMIFAKNPTAHFT